MQMKNADKLKLISMQKYHNTCYIYVENYIVIISRFIIQSSNQ